MIYPGAFVFKFHKRILEIPYAYSLLLLSLTSFVSNSKYNRPA